MAIDLAHLKRGVQIAYVPNHADGDIGHADVEFGFVSSVTNSGAHCRYWLDKKYWHGSPNLRTKANSELTEFGNLLIYDFVDQLHVNKAIKDFVE